MQHDQDKSKPVNILLTGGHGATTGIAVIEEVKKRFPLCNLFWIGTKSVLAGASSTSLEYKVYPSLGVKYYSIHAGRLQTRFTVHTIPLLFLIPFGFFESLILFVKIKPKVILSFGGHSSFPVVFWGWVFGVPIILHEQTVVAGRASSASAFFATKIALGRESSKKYFPKEKCIVTGNPLRRDILLVKSKDRLSGVPTILVIGGSRGSEFINEEISKALPRLTAKYKVIHVTGERDFEKYNKKSHSNYTVFGFVDPKKMASLYEKSDLIVSRAGANSVSEILFVCRPSVLIPLPRTYKNEQVENAMYVKNLGAAEVLLENEVTSLRLIYTIGNIFSNWLLRVQKIRRIKNPDINASAKVADLIVEYL